MNKSSDMQTFCLISRAMVQDFVSDNFDTKLTTSELRILTDLIWENLDGFYDWIEPGVSHIIKSRKP